MRWRLSGTFIVFDFNLFICFQSFTSFNPLEISGHLQRFCFPLDARCQVHF